MKNKRINLFFGKKDYQDIQRYFRIFRLVIFGFSVLLSVFVLIISSLNYSQKKDIEKKTETKRNNLQLFNSQKEQEVKLIKISNKLKDLETFSKDDAQFYPYYNMLVSVFNKSEEVPKINSLLIEKDRNFSFSISFTTKENLLKSFEFVETEDFLKNFENISLKSVSEEESDFGKNYIMIFEGKFKQINENKN